MPFKVEYSNSLKGVDAKAIFDSAYSKKKNDNFAETNLEVNKKLLKKRRSWSHEKEWRLMFKSSYGHKVFCNLVSRIIIDEKAFVSSSAKVDKLIKLASSKSIPVFIRKLDFKRCDFYYEEYKF